MAWYRNFYRCSECETLWSEEWSCCCDDECPTCQTSDFSPYRTDDISVLVAQEDDGLTAIYYSPPDADDSANYKFLAQTNNQGVCQFLEMLAKELSRAP